MTLEPNTKPHGWLAALGSAAVGSLAAVFAGKVRNGFASIGAGAVGGELEPSCLRRSVESRARDILRLSPNAARLLSLRDTAIAEVVVEVVIQVSPVVANAVIVG